MSVSWTDFHLVLSTTHVNDEVGSKVTLEIETAVILYFNGLALDKILNFMHWYFSLSTSKIPRIIFRYSREYFTTQNIYKYCIVLQKLRSNVL